MRWVSAVTVKTEPGVIAIDCGRGMTACSSRAGGVGGDAGDDATLTVFAHAAAVSATSRIDILVNTLGFLRDEYDALECIHLDGQFVLSGGVGAPR